MATSFLKECELSFRRFLIRLLQTLIRHRSTPFDGNFPSRAKVLFIRQDMLGDVLVSTALFRALQQRYPDATLDAILSPKNHFALSNNLNIRKKWIYDKSLGGSWQLIKQLRLERYDFAIDLMDNPSATSTLLCLLSGARWNVGIEKDNAYIYDIRVPMRSRKDDHIIVRLGELLRPFGIVPERTDLRPEYHPSSEARQAADDFFEKAGLSGKKVLGVNISAGTDVRFWGIGNFKAFISTFRTSHPDWSILVLYKPSDMGRARTIAQADRSIILSDPTPTFDHFAAIIQKLQVLLTPDTSAVHLASAYRLSCVVLYVQSDPNLRIWDPYDTPTKTLVTEFDDLTKIPVDDVSKAMDSLLRETGMDGQ